LFFFCRYKIQHFNAVSSQTSGSLLLLSAIGIIIPTAAQRLGTTGDEEGTAVLGMLAQGMAQDKVRLGGVHVWGGAAFKVYLHTHAIARNAKQRVPPRQSRQQ
jgi:Ca2+/H+ antiporter